LPEALLNSSPARAATYKPARDRVREPAKPFRSGLVDWENFPHDEWGRLLGRFWRNPSIAMLEHHDAFGWMTLREAIARHLYEWRGISCEASQVIMTAGGMDAFDLINRSIFKPGDKIWMEEPGYPTAKHVFSMGGVKTVAVPVDGDGMMVVKGRERAEKARGAFVTPARQYPMGVTMPLQRRLELLDWADEARAVVIEDDYDSEYRYVGRPLPALMSLDRKARVIYSGSFSKVFSPILRLGYIVVPQAMLEKFRSERLSHGAPPSLLAQPALCEFMATGAFAIHIRRMRRIYASRRAALIEALEVGQSGQFTIDASPSGLMLLLRLKPNDNDEALVARLSATGLEAQSLSSHYAGRDKEQGLMLSFAGFTEKELRASAKRLIEVLRAQRP
jgi:GntR family transcriptional regulator / MocR family aminotransferase